MNADIINNNNHNSLPVISSSTSKDYTEAILCNKDYTFANPFPQRFSLPAPIIQYIIDNPTPATWKKVLQTCKYFFSKRQIIPVHNIVSKSCITNAGQWDFDESLDIRVKHLLWAHGSLTFTRQVSISKFLPKLAYCELKSLDLFCQTLSNAEFDILTKSKTIERLLMYGNKMVSTSGESVTCDQLFENMDIATFVYISFGDNRDVFKVGTATKLVKLLKNMKKLQKLIIGNVPTSFDVVTFAKFLLNKKGLNAMMEFQNPFGDAFMKSLDKSIADLFKTDHRLLEYNSQEEKSLM